MSSEEAAQLEEQLKKEPDDLQAHIKLLGYYQRPAPVANNNNEATHTKHVLWIIQHHPECEVVGLPEGTVQQFRDATGYEMAKDAWLDAVKKHDDDARVLGNASQFFMFSDRKLSQELMEKAVKLQPNEARWADKLAHQYALADGSGNVEEKNQKALAQFERAQKLSSTPLERFYRLDDMARAAYAAGDLEKASSYANEVLALVKDHTGNWNCGNAINHGNIVLGRVALKNGDVKKACEFLLKAGETTGSPQLDSFGPNMSLAKDLLEKGEKETVLKYFEQCRSFWKLHSNKLDEWKSDIAAGKAPDFGANLLY